MEQLIQRRVQGIARQRITESPVVLLQGPRSIGKSTLLRALAEEHGGHVVDFDDPAVRAIAADDPGLFVVGPRPVFIDEYQHVPEVLDSIKAELNRDGSPGQFVITGSTRFDSLPLAAQSLTGRLHRIEIHPLSQGEIGESCENLLETLFVDASTVVTPQTSTSTRAEYANRIARGGFPLAQERTGASRARWFDDYLTLCLERDLLELGRVRQPSILAPLLTRLAAQTAQLLNMSQAGASVGLAASTTTDYVKLFESSFLVRLLPGWGKTLRTSVASRPKLHIIDSGLAARLLRLPPDKLAGLDPTSLQQFGHLLETFVVGEVLKQASWLDHRPHVGHWRTHDGAEVDLVIEDGHDGSVIGIEVKASGRVHRRDRHGLRRLRETLGKRFVAGVVFYTGAHCVRYEDDDRIIALPIDRLWTGASA